MLMAAGLGTRLRPFTELEPKALLPLLGVPMAQFALDAAVAAGVDRVVANVHHLADRAIAGLHALERGGAELIVSDESQELLGSAGGLRHAAPAFRAGEPFFLLNADVLCDVDLAALGRAHSRLRARHGVSVTLTVFERPPLEPGETQREAYREILFDPSVGLVSGLGAKALGRPYFVGAAVVEPDALSAVPASGPAEFVPTVLEPAIRDKRAGVYFARGRWHDVGSPALWQQAHLALIAALETGRLSRAWRTRLEKGNRRIAPQTWVSASAPGRLLKSARWAGPSYWNALHDQTALPPAELGPRAVLYGTAQGISHGPSLSEGIGYRGVWTSLQASSLPG
jgi:NDP-sugar pyrophosphorylase family protein